MARLTRAEAIERLQQCADEIPQLKNGSNDDPQFIKWRFRTIRHIGNVFGKNSSKENSFRNIQFTRELSVWIAQKRYNPYYNPFHDDLEKAQVLLELMIEEIEDNWGDNEQIEQINSIPSPESSVISTLEEILENNKRPDANNKVFVVHGRDKAAKEEVARFLGDENFETIILDEQPNEGQTLFEKFKKHAKIANFAVILLTPDDVGALTLDQGNLEDRARQNVIFEMGYFFAQLPQNRVAVLVKGSLEGPSDIHGIVYIKLDDDGGWKDKLRNEFQAAGLNVDANRAL